MGMSDLEQLEAQFNRLILEDKAEEAIARFYAEDASLQENSEPPIVGKPAILERERGFLANVESARPPVLHGSAVGVSTSVTFSEWTYDMTFKDGKRFVLNEVARRQWKDGKVVHERFYYTRA
jgi:ketosteroid isomerase-like protein